MHSLDETRSIAANILNEKPDPVVRLRLFRDVLNARPNDISMGAAKMEVLNHAWVKELASEQEKDGGWGRFHTMDTWGQKKKFKTTEIAIERANALGIDLEHPILKKASTYMESLLREEIPIPDPVTVNPQWPMGLKLIIAGTLASFSPKNDAITQTHDLWLNILDRSFSSGEYSAENEDCAHVEITGYPASNTCLAIRNRYTISLMGSRPNEINPDIEKSYVKWIYENPYGIGYLGEKLSENPVSFKPGKIDRWFSSHELLANFPGYKLVAGPTVDWLWNQRNSEKLWDFGPRDQNSHFFPLSTSWRTGKARLFDWSTRVLILLKKFYS